MPMGGSVGAGGTQGGAPGGAGGELGNNEGPGGGGGYRKRKLTEQQMRQRVLGRSAGDPFLTVTRGTIKRGQDTGMPTTTVTSKGGLDENFGERSGDPRNWEYWYKKEHGANPIAGTYSMWEGGKGGEQVTRSRQSKAIEQAERMAKKDGQFQYEIDELRAETKRLTELTAYREEASTPFSSQKAAMGLRASQARTRRSSARGLGLKQRSYQRVANLG